MFIFKSKQKRTYICFSLNDLLFIGLKWYFPKNLQIRDNIRILFNKYLIAYHIPSITIISSVGIETNVTSTSPKGTPQYLIGETDPTKILVIRTVIEYKPNVGEMGANRERISLQLKTNKSRTIKWG